MQRPVPALVIATTLLAPKKINTKLCQERLLDIFLGQTLFGPIVSAPPTLNSLRCFCVHSPEF